MVRGVVEGPTRAGEIDTTSILTNLALQCKIKTKNEETNINPNYNLQYLIDLFNYLHVHRHHWAMAVDTRNLGLSDNEYKTEENRNRQT